jgi:hypothetical protein
MLGLATIGTGIEPPAEDHAHSPCRIDREPVGQRPPSPTICG